MSGCIPNGNLTVISASRGHMAPCPVGISIGVAAWATDPIGNFNLTLTNVVVGSSIQVEKQSDGTVFYNGTAATSNPSLVLSAYASGNGNNALRIKVRKGSSSPTYKPFETLATAIVGAQSIYVGQIPDE